MKFLLPTSALSIIPPLNVCKCVDLLMMPNEAADIVKCNGVVKLWPLFRLAPCSDLPLILKKYWNIVLITRIWWIITLFCIMYYPLTMLYVYGWVHCILLNRSVSGEIVVTRQTSRVYRSALPCFSGTAVPGSVSVILIARRAIRAHAFIYFIYFKFVDNINVRLKKHMINKRHLKLNMYGYSTITWMFCTVTSHNP